MTEAAKAAKREYAKAYREKNRERINEQRKEWNKKNPGKRKAYNERYWEKKAGVLNEQ